jgi:hypothetical protein
MTSEQRFQVANEINGLWVRHIWCGERHATFAKSRGSSSNMRLAKRQALRLKNVYRDYFLSIDFP